MRRTIILAWSFIVAISVQSQPVADMLPSEKIFAHTDKDFYLAGEVIWFKAYVVNQSDHKPNALSKTAYAELIGPAGLPVFQGRVQLVGSRGSGSFLLPPNATSGAYELHLYTSSMKHQPQTIFRKNLTVLNTQKVFDTAAFVLTEDPLPAKVQPGSLSSAKEQLRLHTDKPVYGQREAATIKMSSIEAAKAAPAHVSVTVMRLNDLTAPSGLTENGPARGIPFSKHPASQNQFLPEANGFIVTAEVKDPSGKPASKVPLLLSVTGKLADVQYNESDENGLAHFNLKNLYGNRDLFIAPAQDYEGKVHIQFVRPFLASESQQPLERPYLSTKLLELVEDMHNNLMVRNSFFGARQDDFAPENTDSLSFYGKPDAVYYLDRYKRFVTMEEVLREYVQEVSVRLRSKNFYLSVFSKQLFALSNYVVTNKVLSDHIPLILLDGIPITANKLMEYDPLKVRKIELITDRYIISRGFYDGILSFTTYKGDFDGLELGEDELLSETSGWQYQRQFFAPDYSRPDLRSSRAPDFRELLLWQPELEIAGDTPAQVSFFTGDLTGEFLVVIQGLSDDGRPIYQTTTFRVE